jgi:hypothetical protein
MRAALLCLLLAGCSDGYMSAQGWALAEKTCAPYGGVVAASLHVADNRDFKIDVRCVNGQRVEVWGKA